MKWETNGLQQDSLDINLFFFFLYFCFKMYCMDRVIISTPTSSSFLQLLLAPQCISLTTSFIYFGNNTQSPISCCSVHIGVGVIHRGMGNVQEATPQWKVNLPPPEVIFCQSSSASAGPREPSTGLYWIFNWVDLVWVATAA